MLKLLRVGGGLTLSYDAEMRLCSIDTTCASGDYRSCLGGFELPVAPHVPLHDNLGEYDRDNSGESGRGYRDNLGASRAESRVKPRLPSDLSLAELFLEVLKLKQGALATALLFCWRTGRRKRDRHLGRGFWAEPNAADVEVFLEAVQLEEVG